MLNHCLFHLLKMVDKSFTIISQTAVDANGRKDQISHKKQNNSKYMGNIVEVLITVPKNRIEPKCSSHTCSGGMKRPLKPCPKYTISEVSNGALLSKVGMLVPLKGGRWHIIPQLAVYTTYIPLIVLAFWGAPYATYHLLGEPETTIDSLGATNSHSKTIQETWEKLFFNTVGQRCAEIFPRFTLPETNMTNCT